MRIAWPSLAVAAITVCAAGTAAAPAIACSKTEGCTETSKGTAPPNGSLLTHTDKVPANATSGSFKLEPLPGTDPHAFDEITSTLVEGFPWLAKTSKLNQARLACVLLSFLPIANSPPNEPYTFEDVKKQVMLLNICLQMAQAIPKHAVAHDGLHTAASACGRFDAGTTVKVTHSSSGYRGTVTGKIHDAAKPRLVVSCSRSGSGLLFKVRPRKHGQKLRAAAGPTLAIAYANPTSKPVGIKTTFKVKVK